MQIDIPFIKNEWRGDAKKCYVTDPYLTEADGTLLCQRREQCRGAIFESRIYSFTQIFTKKCAESLFY